MIETLTDRPLALVTGAGGWLGSRLVRAILEGLPDQPAVPRDYRNVRALAVDDTDAARLRERFPSAEVYVGDLRSGPGVDRFCAGASGAVLFHTAGVIHPRRVRDFYAVNVDGASRLLRSAASAGITRAVVVSSNSPFGSNRSPDERFDESAPYHPYMNYGRSKMQMEQAVLDASGRGLDCVIVRAPWFYGPGQPPRQTQFFTMIRDGQVPVVGTGENRRSMAYVDNLCQGLLLAAAAARPAPAYWIADERPYTMNEIIDTVERLLETEFHTPCAHRRRRLPGAASTVARWVDRAIQSTGLYEQRIHVLSEMNQTIACDVALARRDLGYRPAIALEEGMRRSLQYCFAEGMLA